MVTQTRTHKETIPTPKISEERQRLDNLDRDGQSIPADLVPLINLLKNNSHIKILGQKRLFCNEYDL